MIPFHPDCEAHFVGGPHDGDFWMVPKLELWIETPIYHYDMAWQRTGGLSFARYALKEVVGNKGWYEFRYAHGLGVG